MGKDSNQHSPIINNYFESPQEYDGDSLQSTDENFLGVTDSHPVAAKLEHSSVWRRIQKLNKSAIGPKNLELKQCTSSYYGLSQTESMRSRMVPSKFLNNFQFNYCQIDSMINNKTGSVGDRFKNESFGYKPKHRFGKG